MAEACCSTSIIKFPLPSPANLTATPTDSTIALTWDAVEGAASYTVMWSGGGVSGSESVTDPSYTITDLPSGTTFDISVVAVPVAGSDDDPSWPSHVTATTAGEAQLPTPTNVAAGSITETGASVSWGAVTGADSYAISWALASDPGTPVGSDTATGSPFAITGLTAGTDYIASVVATDSTGAMEDSAPGTVAFSTTAAPAQLATPQNIAASNVTAATAVIAWDAVTGADGYLVNYTPGGTETGVTDPTINLEGLTASTEYTVSVVATDSTGAATDSEPGTGTFTTTA